MMASDRRLSRDKDVISEDAGKAGFIQAADGTALYAYTGLARLGRFDAREWIQSALIDSASSTLNETLHKFAEVAGRKFGNLTYRGHGLTLAVAGFSSHVGQFMGAVSNLENADGSFLERPSRDFVTRIMISPAEKPGSLSGVMVNGYNQGEYLAELAELNRLVLTNAPAQGTGQKAVQLIRTLADHPHTGNTVGKNVMRAILQAPAQDAPVSIPSALYSGFEEADRVYLLDMIDLRQNAGIAVRDIQLVFEEGSQLPRNIGRNERCFCGSSIKYKYCHGR